MEVVTAPVISMQHDWEVSLNTNTKDTAWVSCSTFDNQTHKTNTKQGEITFVKSKDGTTASATPPFSVSIVNSGLKWISVQNTDTNTSTDIFAPTRQLNESSKKAIRSLGVSPQGGLGVYGSDDGILRVCDVQDASIRRNLEGHKGDVTYCGFFPSGQVVLSGALDWRLKIWNLATGDCAATLTGHGGSILGADFIERGRNIISCSRDGTVKLWDVPTQTSIATFATPGEPGFRSAVNDCHVFTHDTTQAQGCHATADAREVGTEGKAITTAGEDGVLRVFDIRSRNEVATFAAPPDTQNSTTTKEEAKNAFNCCATAHLSGTGRTVVGGTESGHIVAWDLRSPSLPLHTLRLTSAPIKRLAFSLSGKLWAATGDGSTLGIRWDAHAATVAQRTRVDVALTGSNFEPIFGLGLASQTDNSTLVATGARDGVVRFYFVH